VTNSYDYYCGTHVDMNSCAAIHQSHCRPMYEFPRTPPPIKLLARRCELTSR
jgi:hypothetical protein